MRKKSRRRTATTALPLAVVAALITTGVVMAKTDHVPIAILPDAPRIEGAQLATFALG